MVSVKLTRALGAQEFPYLADSATRELPPTLGVVRRFGEHKASPKY